LTIGSHPLADSRGAADHEGQTFAEVIEAIRPIIAAVDVPVSVDLEAGYGQDPADLIAGLLDAGGVGLNVEDTVHSQDGRVRSTEEHAAYVAGLRGAARWSIAASAADRSDDQPRSTRPLLPVVDVCDAATRLAGSGHGRRGEHRSGDPAPGRGPRFGRLDQS